MKQHEPTNHWIGFRENLQFMELSTVNFQKKTIHWTSHQPIVQQFGILNGVFWSHSWLVSLMAQRPDGWVSATRYTCVSTKPQHSQGEADKKLNNYILQPLKSWKSMDKSKTWKIWRKHDETSLNYHPGFTNSSCFLAYETTASCWWWSFKL